MDAGDKGFMTLSAHESLTPLSTYAASVSDAIRRTLWSLSHTYRQQLHDMKFRHLPLRLSGGSQTSIVLGGASEDRLNTLAGVVAGLNTNLDSATLNHSRVHLELEDAHARIAALEAQLQGRDPPEAQVPTMPLSPPHKRIRYGEPGSITRLIWIFKLYCNKIVFESDDEHSFISYAYNNNNHVMVLVAMFDLDFRLSAMVLWNDGHKNIKKQT
jgi:hypothetical protein